MIVYIQLSYKTFIQYNGKGILKKTYANTGNMWKHKKKVVQSGIDWAFRRYVTPYSVAN